MKIKFGSVCSGIEAASVAWEPLGWRASWLSEIEPFPSSVLAHHWPDVPNLGDMNDLPTLIELGAVDAPEVLVGGTPCTAFSVAGARAGLVDPRGQLTMKYVEVADAIDRVRAEDGEEPCIIVWENVPGVLNIKDNAFGCFLGALCGESDELRAPGGRWANSGVVFGPQRAVAWRVLDAQFFGVAQRRRRVFLVASARDGFNPAQVLFEREGVRRDSAPSRETWQGAATLASSGVGTCGAEGDRERAGHLIPTSGCWWDGGQVSQTLDAVLHKGQTMPEKNRFPAVLQPANDNRATNPILEPGSTMGAVTYGIPGNWIGRAPENGGNAVEPMRDVSPCQTGTDRHAVAYAFAQNSRDEVRFIGGDGQISGALAAQPGMKQTTYLAQQAAVAFDGYNQTINPHTTQTIRADKSDGDHVGMVLQTFSSDDGASNRTPTYMQGYADTVGALCARDYKGVGNQFVQEGKVFPSPTYDMAVRRLTPTECERLQGFPDGHTDVPHRNKPAADGPRYKALGNSKAVPVVRWIGRRIEAAIANPWVTGDL